MIFFKLFYEFFKIGLFSIGGGMATVPFLYKLSVSTGWFTTQELANMLAVSESTPGPIGVNMATYVGYVTAGPLGSVVATLGLATPEVIVILIVAKILDKFRKSKIVDNAFYGIRPCSIGLIASAGYLVAKICILKNNLVDIKSCILIVALFVLIRFIPKVKNLHPICFILFSAVVGIIFSF